MRPCAASSTRARFVGRTAATVVAKLLAAFASGALSLQNLPNQIAMLAWKLETFDEAKVILIYHLVGTV